MNNEIKEVVISSIDYIERLEKEVPKLIERYRQEVGYIFSDDMGALMEGLDWINQVLGYTREYHGLDLYEFKRSLLELMEALESKDRTLIGDIIEYEIMPILVMLKENFELSIKVN